MEAIKVDEVLHMNGGAGETSYAKNSAAQANIIQAVQPIVKKAIVDLCSTFHESLAIADLGCSSGSNTLSTIAGIIDTIFEECCRLHHPLPEVSIFLNDLPGNDFNLVFRSLPDFYERLRKWKEERFGSCFVAGVPGSFYGRVFPSKSLHFVHSSSSLHWLSQVPQGLESKEGMPLNQGAIYISKKSPTCVLTAYYEQFQRDFSSFLESRSHEIVDGGHMVLTFLGRRCADLKSRENDSLWEVLGEALNDLVLQGLIEKEKVDSFNVPYYVPTLEEVESVVKREGTFAIETLEIFETYYVGSIDNDGNTKELAFDKYAEQVSKLVRAASESMLASHFGESIIDNLFLKFEEIIGCHLSEVDSEFSMENSKGINIVVSMKKKG